MHPIAALLVSILGRRVIMHTMIEANPTPLKKYWNQMIAEKWGHIHFTCFILFILFLFYKFINLFIYFIIILLLLFSVLGLSIVSQNKGPWRM